MSEWECLERDLIEFRDVVARIEYQLLSYADKVNLLFKEIADLSYEESRQKMDILFSIQNDIATVFYKYEFSLSNALERFVRDFDRDDEYSRKYLYEKILNGYSL